MNSPNDEYGMEPPIEEEYHALNLIDVEEIKIYQPNQSLEKSKGHTIWQDLKSSQARLNTLKASQGRLNEIFQLLKGIFRGPNDEQSYKAAPFSGQKKVIQSNLISRYRPDLSAERRQKFNPSKFVLNSPSNRYGLKSPIEEEYHAPNLINEEENEIYQPNLSPAKSPPMCLEELNTISSIWQALEATHDTTTPHCKNECRKSRSTIPIINSDIWLPGHPATTFF